MASQAERRAAMRKRQADREQRTARSVRLARLHQLAEPWPDDPEQLEALACAAVNAEPDGMSVEDLHPRLLEHAEVAIPDADAANVDRSRLDVPGRRVGHVTHCERCHAIYEVLDQRERWLDDGIALDLSCGVLAEPDDPAQWLAFALPGDPEIAVKLDADGRPRA